MDQPNDQIQRAAMERFGLVHGVKDYNLERIVRLVALFTQCRFAWFSVAEQASQIYLATYGAELDTVPAELSVCHSETQNGQPTFVTDLAAHPDSQNRPAIIDGLRLRAFAAIPVYAATRTVIGVLCAADDQPKNLDTPTNQRVFTDCVRLIEDSLMMRGNAIRDPLTGLYNRRFFTEQISAEWRRAMRLQLPISMLVVDIDHFKHYNDAAGHPAGDAAINEVARVLEGKVRRAGDTVCRFGGEEFAMILPMTAAEDAAHVAESIRATVEARNLPHPGHPKGAGLPMTVSIGSATVTSVEDLVKYSADDLLKWADIGLYTAKRAGRNCVRKAHLEHAPADPPTEHRRLPKTA